jgi:site-specific recombinase XerD
MAVDQYVARKRIDGYAFSNEESRLARFCKSSGDLNISDLRSDHVVAYLDGSVVSTVTWRQKYFLLLRFFEFLHRRQAVPLIRMPPLRPAVRQAFVPYIYTQQEIARLLAATSSCQQGQNCMIHAETFHALLLTLYATGVRLGEAVGLGTNDVNFTTGMLNIKGSGLKGGRVIPLNRQLLERLRSYVDWRTQKSIGGEYLFVNEHGCPLTTHNVRHNFIRLCRVSGVTRRCGSPARPRLHDIRQTFAVHRITSWIRKGDDLHRMLPALAAYMGQVGLGSTEKYLLLTPERFRKHLDRLSSSRCTGNWRCDEQLMSFLAGV